MSGEIDYPNVALIYDRKGEIRRTIAPGPGETARYDLVGTESVMLLRSPPADLAALQATLAGIFGAA